MTRSRGGVAVARRRVSNASGIALPGAVSGWTLTMAEDFATPFSAGAVNSSGVFSPPLATSFAAYADGTLDTNGNNNGTNSVYKPSTNLTATGSKLVVLCNVVSAQARSATVVATPAGNYGQSYGRFSVCYRIPSVFHGWKTAFLMWPNGVGATWPRDGEIDWPEGSMDTGGVFGANVLHQGSTVGNHADFDNHRYGTVPAPDGNWHVATLEWASGFVRALWDGTTVGTTYDRVPNTQMYWALQVETDVDRYPDFPISSDTGTVEIDWVATWNPNSPAVPGAGSAPSSTTLLTEAFTGTNGAAISTTNWNSVATTSGSSALIQTNKGRFTTGSTGSYSDQVIRSSKTTQPGDCIITATLNLLTVSECYPWIFFRDDGTGLGGYQLYFYAATSQILVANPADQQVATINWGSTWTTSTSLKVEIIIQSALATIRVWDAAGGRPTNPSVQTNVTSYAGTACGLGLVGGSAAASRSCDWDDFTISSIP